MLLKEIKNENIKCKQEKQDEHNTKFEGKLSKIEASATQAHKRIDTVERYIEHYHMEE